MKRIALLLPVTGLVLGLAAPAGAVGSKSVGLMAATTPSVVYQQEKCKEGEVWDETERKCKKKEG